MAGIREGKYVQPKGIVRDRSPDKGSAPMVAEEKPNSEPGGPGLSSVTPGQVLKS